MGKFNFGENKDKDNHIKKILAKGELKPIMDEEWDIHGPHPDMDYQVFVGPADPLDDESKCRLCDKKWKDCDLHLNGGIVVVHPKGFDMIDDPSDWHKVTINAGNEEEEEEERN